jgi:Lanthionine synthetase C-like protein
MVTTFADAPFSTLELEELLLAGGVLTWNAGPLANGSNLCHGTGGNGYAFLKLYRRTNDRRWLARARLCHDGGRAMSRSPRQAWPRPLFALDG